MESGRSTAATGGPWSVDESAHERFAEASGDVNPLHVDAEAARRLPFGRRAVHGVHLVLAALDRVAEAADLVPHRVRAIFRRSVAPGDHLDLGVVPDGEVVHLALSSDAASVVDIRVEPGDRRRHGPLPATVPDQPPALLSPDEIEVLVGTSRSFDVGGTPDRMAAMFPALVERVGPDAVAELAALSRLVGMEMPGLHSLFSELDVTIGSDTTPPTPAWTLTEYDDRFSRVRLDVTGRTIEGTVRAFVRPEPVVPSLGDVEVDPDAFDGQRWLIVGGSRGLGAVASLLLDAGGAEVCATHFGSPESASRLVDATSRARTVRFDVDDPAAGVDAVTAEGWMPTHLAWFASPPIFDGVEGAWSDRLHARFLEVYVDRFAEVVDDLGPERLVGVLWPSTEAVEHPVRGLAEYAAAKRAGEQRCDELARAHPHLTVTTPRFGRLATDQTASVVPVDNAPPAPELLGALEPFANGA